VTPSTPIPSINLLLDKPRVLTLDFNALTLFEEMTGRNLASGEFHNLTISDVRCFYYCCLVQEDPSITLDQVGSFFLAGHFAEAIDIMLRMLLGDSTPNALAPYVPTPEEVVEAALDLAQIKRGEILYDLGCGDGRVLLAAAKRGAVAIGYEMNEERAGIAAACGKALLLDPSFKGKAPEVRQSLIQEGNFTDADVLFIYLLSNSNTKIRPKLMTELKPGTRIVTHDFPFAGWEAEASQEISLDGRPHRLFLYRMGSQVPASPAPADPAPSQEA